MSNNPANRRNKEIEQKKNDTMVNRMMVIFTAAIVYVVALLLLKKNGTSFETVFVLHALPVIQLITGLLFAGTVAFFLVNRKKGVDESEWFFNTKHFVVLSFILFASAMLYRFIGNTGVVIGVIALLIAAFIYCFYQREFFVYTVFSMFGALGLYGVKAGYSASLVKFIVSIIFIAIAFAAPIVTLIFSSKVKKADGHLKLKGKSILLIKDKSAYTHLLIGSIYVLAAAVVGLIFNSIALYTLIAFLFLYLVFAIVYTVKMM